MARNRIGILINNAAESATLSVTPAAVSTLPVENLNSVFRSEVMRVESTSITLTLEFATLAVNIAVLTQHNLSDTATVSADLMDGATVLETVTPSVSRCVKANFTSVNANKIVWTISDSSLTYIDIGRAFAGWLWQPTFNVDRGAGLDWDDSSTQARAKSGVIHYNNRVRYQKLSLNFSHLTQEEALIVRNLPAGVGMFVSLYQGWGNGLEADTDGVYALTQSPAVTHNFSNVLSYGMECVEI